MILLKILKKIRNDFLRKIIYRKYAIGKGFYAGIRTRIWGKNKIIIGENFYIGRDSFIECDAIIGNNVIFANRVAVIGKYDHNYHQIGTSIRLSMSIRDSNYDWKGLDSIAIIEDDVWVGYGATIFAGVTIGEGSVIGAGSVVINNIEPYSIYVGTPAKKIKNRFDKPEELQKHLKLINSKYSGLI